MMPENATSLKTPPGFLLPDTDYEWEVLAMGKAAIKRFPQAFLELHLISAGLETCNTSPKQGCTGNLMIANYSCVRKDWPWQSV